MALSTRLTLVRRQHLAAVLALTVFVVTPGIASAATYYLSPSGNDANSGAEASPWRTFSKAWQHVKRGDTLVLLDGVYNQILAPSVPAIDPANPQYITIRAKNDGKATIDGRGVVVDNLMFLRGSHLVIEGLVLRNGNNALVRVEGRDHVLRRLSLYEANTDLNSSGISVAGAYDVLIEDVVIAGALRKGVVITRGARVTVRRVFVWWSSWDGRDFCGISWPHGAALEIYDTSDHSFENVIGFSRAPWYLIGLKQQNVIEPYKTVNNKILGSISIHAGRELDGTVVRWPTERPQPTDCHQTIDVHKNYQFRSGFWIAGPGIIRDNLVQDNLAYGNAGVGLAFEASGTTGWDGKPSVSGNVLRRFTAMANGADNPDGSGGRWGGANTDVLQVDLDKFDAVEDSKIDRVFHSWANYPNGAKTVTSLTGGGARLRHRYVDGVLMDGSNGKPAQDLWPWPMEQRIQNEIGMSVTNLVGSIIPDQVSPVTTAPSAPSAPTNLRIVP
jgi:hypothetical protein